MLRLVTVAVLLSLLCHESCVGGPISTVGAPGDIGWQAWLLVDPEKLKPQVDEEKKRRITPKSVFIAPAFSGTSHLPECAEGYRPDSMGRCVKLVQLNHAAQLDFLLQRLNAMYAAPAVRRGSGNVSTSDSSSAGPLQVSLPLEIPPESEEETEESMEVSIVMADVLKDDQLENSDKKNDTEKLQTVVAVLNVGKNGTSLEEIESSSDFSMESDNPDFGKTDLKLNTSNATKYKVINQSENSTAQETSDDSAQTLPETIKAPFSAVGLLEVSNVSSEDGRSGNTSRRNVSADQGAKKEDTTELFLATTAAAVKLLNKSGTKQNRNTSNVHVRVTSEMETQVLPASTYRPKTFVRFPTEKSPIRAGTNVASSKAVHAQDRRHPVKFPQTHFDFQRPGSMLPNDVHQRQTFWWLPTGWRLDPTRHQPMLVTFWARMPLLHDHQMGSSDQDTSTGRRRGPLVY
jgi:hypothetical protein